MAMLAGLILVEREYQNRVLGSEAAINKNKKD
jgi:hypothetical protein